MSNLFQKLEYEAFRAGITPRTKESMTWFRNRVKNLRTVNRKALMADEPATFTSRISPGNMYHFYYDPKHKETLPYYDRFPLIIAVGPAKGGFYGLNLHYLPPNLRAKLLDALMDLASDKKFNDRTKLKLSYKMLKDASRYRWFKPCFKHYLTKHVRSRFSRVPAPEWEIAVFLQTAQFEKATKGKVYADSKRIIAGK